MTEPVAYWTLQVRPTGEILPRHYQSREFAAYVRDSAGADDRVVGMSRRGKVVFDEDAVADESVPREHCAIARNGKGEPCRVQCASCKRWYHDA